MHENAGAVVSLAAARQARNQRQWSNEGGTIPRAWEVYQASGHLVRVRPRTADSYRAAIRQALVELPPTPNALDVQAWAGRMVERDGKSPTTANWAVRSLRAVVEGAELADGEDFTALRKALRGYRRLTEKAQEKRAAPRDAMVRLLSSGVLRHKAEQAFIGLQGLCALRVGEVLGLQAGDWSERDSVLSVTRQRHSPTRKNRKAHKVKVPEPLADWLRWTVRHREDIKPKTGRQGETTSAALFPWGKSYCERLLARVRTVVDLPRGDAWHSFRHLAATERADQTGSVVDVMRILGDASPSAALCYIGQVRGQTEVEPEAVARALLDVRLTQIEMGMVTVSGSSKNQNTVTNKNRSRVKHGPQLQNPNLFRSE